MRQRPHRWVVWNDIRFLIEITIGYLITAVWPRRWDSWIVGRWVNLHTSSDSERVKNLAGLMGALLGTAAAQRDLRDLAFRYWLGIFEGRWGGFRNMHQRGWTPELTVEGIHHIQEGLKTGRGVIVWSMNFCDGAVAKAGLAAAGIRLVHLSERYHGKPSRSWLGLRLAYLGCLPELRYLDRRIVIPADDSLGYMREAMNVLESNGCLSITGERPGGRRSVATAFFGVREKFATGAPGLAHKMGSQLLTLYAVREGSFRYRVVIEGPIEADRNAPRQTFIQTAVEQFSGRLQRAIVAHPSDWLRWHYER